MDYHTCNNRSNNVNCVTLMKKINSIKFENNDMNNITTTTTTIEDVSVVNTERKKK
jgi:hypothetical protein